MVAEDSPPPVRFGRTTIEAVADDLLDQRVQAFVLAGNSRGIMGAGIGAGLRASAAMDLERELMAQAPLSLGSAVVTGSGQLAGNGIEAIIHAIISSYLGAPSSALVVRRAILAALQAAEARRLRSLAIAPLGTAIGAPKGSRADLVEPLVEEIVAYLRRSASRLERVVLVARYPEDVSVMRETIVRARERSWARSA